jgi:hypothetical protein
MMMMMRSQVPKVKIMYDEYDYEYCNREMPTMRTRVDKTHAATPQSVPELQTNPMGSTQPMDAQGFVYFIETQDGQFIKIGFSNRPMVRAGQLGTVMPIRLIGYFPASRATERWLHIKFAANHSMGEWFENTDAIREFIGILGLMPPLPQPIRRIKIEPVEPIDEAEPEEETVGECMAKDQAAVDLVAKRWKKTTKAQRKEIAASMNETRWSKATPEERAAIGKRLAEARAKARTKAAKKAAKKK